MKLRNHPGDPQYRAREAYKAGARAIGDQAQLLRLLEVPDEEIAKAAVQARNDLRNTIRTRSSTMITAFGEHSSSVDDLAARGKDGGGGMIESASKANARYDTIASGARYVGVAGVLVQAGLSAYDIASAPPSQRARIAGQDIGGLGGALAGAEAGSEGGAAIGSLAGPLGTLVDGVVGGLGGAVVGGIAGSSVARWIGGFL